jgi:hypothetical protein
VTKTATIALRTANLNFGTSSFEEDVLQEFGTINCLVAFPDKIGVQ